MLTQTTIIPESMRYVMARPPVIFYALSDDEGVEYGHFAIHLSGLQCQVHMQFLPGKFTLSAYKSLKRHDWITLKSMIRQMGCKQIVAMHKEPTDKKFLKFLAIAGFTEINTVTIASMEA